LAQDAKKPPGGSGRLPVFLAWPVYFSNSNSQPMHMNTVIIMGHQAAFM
jgi:hypothetical protein